eukprot:scaffold995_cov244-Pinguiococcus_pyrenoidosus.AAC.6
MPLRRSRPLGSSRKRRTWPGSMLSSKKWASLTSASAEAAAIAVLGALTVQEFIICGLPAPLHRSPSRLQSPSPSISLPLRVSTSRPRRRNRSFGARGARKSKGTVAWVGASATACRCCLSCQ